jgi:hypothetical protein
VRNNKLFSLLLAPLLVLVLSASAVLVDPGPIAVPPGLSDAAVAKAIRLGVAQRGWVVNRSDPGYMEATLHLRSHVATIGLKFDTKQIEIHYVSSENLDYEVEKGVPHIHGNYLKWVNNVVHDISIQLLAITPAEGAGSGTG